MASELRLSKNLNWRRRRRRASLSAGIEKDRMQPVAT